MKKQRSGWLAAMVWVWTMLVVGLLELGIAVGYAEEAATQAGHTQELSKEESLHDHSRKDVPAVGVQAEQDTMIKDLQWRQMFRPGERVLFVGDQATQQMTWTRSVATAMVLLMPGQGVRFFNGGYEGATAEDALEWIDELCGLVRPTMVVVALGNNDAKGEEAVGVLADKFEKDLGELVEKIKSNGSVSQVILLTPVPTQTGLNARLDGMGMNSRLEMFAQRVLKVAEKKKTAYVDWFSHGRSVMDAAAGTQGEPLVINGEVPNELGGVVLASVLLKGWGVQAQELEKVAWWPLAARKMGRIRHGLALEIKPPSPEAAELGRQVYEQILLHDQSFFRVWRVEGKRAGGNRALAMAAADQAWGRVEALVEESQADAKTENKGKMLKSGADKSGHGGASGGAGDVGKSTK